MTEQSTTEVVNTITLRMLAAKLQSVRTQIKELEETEDQIKRELSNSWGPITIKSETRDVGSGVKLNVTMVERTEFDPGEYRGYLKAMNREDLFDQTTEVKVKKDEVQKLVKNEVLPDGVLDLLHETSSYVQWKVTMPKGG
jgi:hypothetical protein